MERTNWNDEAIAGEAGRLRARAATDGFAVSVETVGRDLGLDVRVVAEGIAGRLLPNRDGTPVSGLVDFARGRVVVDGREPLARQRFTIAHEIGHEVLGHEQVLGSGLHVEHVVLDDIDRVTVTADRLEREADRFAAALLAPPAALEEAVVEHGGVHVPTLARSFGISGAAATRQLVRAGMLPDLPQAVRSRSHDDVVRLLHVSDSDLGLRPYGVPALEEALWAAWNRCLDTAIDLGVDVLVHSGRLLADVDRTPRLVERLRRSLERTRPAGMDVVVHESGRPLPDVDVDVLRQDDGALEVRGLRFALPSHPPPLQPWVLVAHGSVAGLGGRVGDMEQLPADVADVDAAWCALGGLSRCQPVHPTAWFAGRIGGVSALDSGVTGGVLVDVDRASGNVVDTRRASWADVPHEIVTLDGFGMPGAAFLDVVEQRLARLPDGAVVRLAARDPALGAGALRAAVESGLGRSALVLDVHWGADRMVLTPPG